MSTPYTAADYARDFKISNNGAGTAHPTFGEASLPPEALDDVLGVADKRAAWVAANATGVAAYRALRAARAAWIEAHPRTDFAEHAEWVFACDLACRDLAVEVDTCGKRAARALRSYIHAQREAADTGRAKVAAAYLDADAKARAALDALDASLLLRERLMQYLVTPEASATPGRGHFTRSSALGERRDGTARHQREEMRVVVDSAPRDLVAAIAEESR